MIVKGDGAGKYCVGMCIFLFRNLKSRIKRDVLQVVANLMIVTYLLYTISVIPPPSYV